MFSETCKCGITTAIYIVGQSLFNKKGSLKDFAKAIDLPEVYTLKILQQLSRNHIIVSEKKPVDCFLMNKQEFRKVMLSIIALIKENSLKVC
jgi:DNA-binding IscR family transcriptional regulator